jgi:hypothetical protein
MHAQPSVRACWLANRKCGLLVASTKQQRPFFLCCILQHAAKMKYAANVSSSRRKSRKVPHADLMINIIVFHCHLLSI